MALLQRERQRLRLAGRDTADLADVAGFVGLVGLEQVAGRLSVFKTTNSCLKVPVFVTMNLTFPVGAPCVAGKTLNAFTWTATTGFDVTAALDDTQTETMATTATAVTTVSFRTGSLLSVDCERTYPTAGPVRCIGAARNEACGFLAAASRRRRT